MKISLGAIKRRPAWTCGKFTRRWNVRVPARGPRPCRCAGGVMVLGLQGGRRRVGAFESEPPMLYSQNNLPACLRPSGGNTCHDPRLVTSKCSHSSSQRLHSLVISGGELCLQTSASVL